MEEIYNFKKPFTDEQSHIDDGKKVKEPFTTSKGISLLNSEPNNNNTNNNNTNFEVVNDAFTLLPSENLMDTMVNTKSKPLIFWILHLFSVEGKSEMTSTTVAKLLKEKYGLEADEKAVMVELALLVKRGVLKRRRPWHIHAGGRGGVRKCYYYSYTSIDRLCKAMASYDDVPQNVQDREQYMISLLEKHIVLLEKAIEILSRIEMKLDLR